MKKTSFACALVLAACAGSPTPEAVDPVEESDHPIDQWFANLGKLAVSDPKRVEGTPSAPAADGDYQCVETPVEEVRQYDQLLGQLSVGDVLWPGSMLRGDSVYSGRLTPISLPRAPLTFSVSLESLGGGARSATLESPSLSSYRDAVGKILAQQLSGATPARISSEVEEVSSEEQLAVALGASVSAPMVATVKAGFNFEDTSKRSRYVVKFFQLYYTVDVDPPALPHQFFAPTVTVDDVAAVASAESPPVYVSSIGYGRQVIFTFESSLSKTELQTALSFVYQGGTEISGDVSLTHKEVLDQTKTTAFILGGDGGGAAAVSIGGFEQLKAFIATGGNYSKDSPGAAIAYKLSYVRDHAPVQVSFASTYTQRTCSRISQKLRVVFENIKVENAGSDGGDDLEVFGTVEVLGSGDTYQVLADWSAAQYKRVATGSTYPTSGILGEAIVAVTPQPGNHVRIETSLYEYDGISDDSFGYAIADIAPFESGWRRTLYLNRSNGSQQITLQVSLTPVP